jgi:hypothetical protein
LQVYPNYQHAYQRASFLYHEILFNFQLAYELDEPWLEKNPDEPLALVILPRRISQQADSTSLCNASRLC